MTHTRNGYAAGWRNWGSPEVPVTSQVTGTLQALRIFEAIEDPNAERVRALLAELGWEGRCDLPFNNERCCHEPICLQPGPME